MAKYMTRTVDTYIYHLGSIENSGDATTIIPVIDIFSEKKLGERETKKLLKYHCSLFVYFIDNVPHT